MTWNRSYGVAALAMTLAVGSGLLAQAPTPPPGRGEPEQAPKGAPGRPAPAAKPPQAAPSGIQTLPLPSGKDSVKPEEVVLTIGLEKITRERFEQIKKGLPPQYSGVPQQMGDKGFATNYATFRSLALVGEREKLDQLPEFKEQLNFLRMELLARLAISEFQNRAQTITDEEVKAYHAAHQAEFQQAKVKGILVALNPPAKPAATPPAAPGTPAPKPETPKARTDGEAKARAEELRKQILAGADFAAVARASSDHQATAEKGGDFGNIRKGQLPANIEKMVFSLKPKEVSEPIKESQGYYIFQVDEVRPVTLDEATATIRSSLQQKKFTDALEKAKVDFPVTMNDRYFAEPQAEQASAPGVSRPVITGVAPAQPGTAGTPAPKAEKKDEKKSGKKDEK